MSKPAYDKQSLYTKLDSMNIEYTVHNHPPVFTVEDAQQHTMHMQGIQIKNLFVYDKKKNMWLITVPHSLRPDLKKLKSVLNASGNLSFCNADRLWENLGVKPGSVTPLSVINDTNNNVTAVIDADCISNKTVCPHPLLNDATLEMLGTDILSFMQMTNHNPIIINFKAEELVVE